eukprot:COSAG02_NODE_20892_length_811_cov_1.581461_1_plen_132_part_00
MVWVQKEFVRRNVTSNKVLQTGGKIDIVKLSVPELKEIVKLYWTANTSRAAAAKKQGPRQPTTSDAWKAELERLVRLYGFPVVTLKSHPGFKASCLARVKEKIEQWPAALREGRGRQIVTATRKSSLSRAT